MNWWVEQAWQDPAGPIVLFSWVFWVIGSIVLHELAHGWAAIRQGDDTPIVTGHMTWNPIVHMGPMSLVVFALLGLAWGQMPVDPSRFRGRRGESYVAAAGPAMNLLLAAVALGGLVLWLRGAAGVSDPMRTNVAIFLERGAVLNIVLMLFNLVPVPPLDGSRILADFVPAYNNLWRSEAGGVIAIVVMLFAFNFAGNLFFGLAGDLIGAVLGIFL